MVVLWAVDLSQQLATLAYALGGLVMLILFFRFIPWLDSPSWSILKKLRLQNYGVVTEHFKIRMYLEGAVVVVAVTDILSLVVYPPAWKNGVEYFVLVSRQIPNGAHISSYVMILVLIVCASVKFDDALKGIIYGGFAVFIHEGMWFPFYYASNWGALNYELDAGFVAWIVCIAIIARKKYGIKVHREGWFIYTGFLIAWFSTGFDITVKNVDKVFFKTPFYLSFSANATEVVSWSIVFIWFMWGLFGTLNGGGWKLLDNYANLFKPSVQANPVVSNAKVFGGLSPRGSLRSRNNLHDSGSRV